MPVVSSPLEYVPNHIYDHNSGTKDHPECKPPAIYMFTSSVSYWSYGYKGDKC